MARANMRASRTVRWIFFQAGIFVPIRGHIPIPF
jgi:hypothetical protein